MTMRRFAKIAAALIGIFTFIPASGETSEAKKPDTPSFQEKLEKKVNFETAGKTFIESVLDIAYQHDVPMGIEYVGRDAVSRPINLRFQNESVREILVALTRQIPEYQITFSDGLVDIFVPRERQDPSNLL